MAISMGKGGIENQIRNGSFVSYTGGTRGSYGGRNGNAESDDIDTNSRHAS